MKEIELINRNLCPLCNSACKSDFINFPEIPVVQCTECKFIYSAKIMSEDYLTSYYATNFGSLRHQQGQIVNGLMNSWVFTKLIGSSEIKNVLDVGTGYGFFIKDLRDKIGINVTGVELSAQEANYGIVNLKLNISNTMLSKSNLPKNYYDVVTNFEVIEHITEPKKFVNELVEYIKPHGFLLIMTDNFESNAAKSLGAGFPKWIPHSHISHFAPSTFENLLKEAGLEIQGYLSYTPWELNLRDLYYKFRNIKKQPGEAFKLSNELATEMHGTFRLFQLRKLINKYWVQFTSKPNLEGAQMYILARKI